MKYRKFGALDWRVSALGFGAMRLPIIDGNDSEINESKAVKMIRYAIDNGVNYVDTAQPYHNGNSEILVGKALQEGYRERTKVATKLPYWNVNSFEDMNKCLSEQLEKLQTKYVDFYLLHGLNSKGWKKLLDLRVFDWLEKVKDEGKIKYVGFSFHDSFSLFKEIIDGFDDWSFCQIQYNYVDSDYQAGVRGLKYAASKGLGVVVMEPLAGGILASKPHPSIEVIWDEIIPKRSPADLALRWVWNQPEVSVVLSGMSTMQQVKENIKSANHSGVNTLTKQDLNLVSKLREASLKIGKVRCTNCRYCLPCPSDVVIPEIFNLYNEFCIKNEDPKIIKKYNKKIPLQSRASNCVQCGQCEERCPQQIPIRNILKGIGFFFESST